MIRRLLAVLSLLVLCLSASSVAPPNSLYLTAHKTTHHITQHVAIGDDDSCSATAIGPHALLTASHCEMPVDKVAIDGALPVTILRIVRDNQDHSIYYVDHTFPSWAEVDLHAEMWPGAHVFMYGNPGRKIDVFREGTVAETKYANADDFMMGLFTGTAPILKTLYNMKIFFGDSGSGVFDDRGKVVDVISFIDYDKVDDAPDASISYAGAYQLAFSQAQLDEAKK